MDRLSNVLPFVLRKRGIAAHAESALVLHRAHQWIADHHAILLSFITIQHLKDGVLCIACSHSAAAQDSQAFSGNLRDYLRVECPFAAVSEVRITRL